MVDNIASPPIVSGDRTAASHRDWLVDELVAKANALIAEVTALETDSSLVARWPLYEGAGTVARDVSINGHNGTITPGTSGAWSDNSPFRKSYLFDGSSSYATVDQTDVLNAAGPVTIAAWIRPDGAGGSNLGSVLGKASGGTHYERFGVAAGAALGFRRRFSTTDGYWVSAGDVPLSRWNFVAVTYDHGSAANDPVFYVNGVISATTESVTPVGTPTANDATDLEIGRSNGANNWFAGRIADLRVYDRILTQDEIARLYMGACSDNPTLYALTVVDKVIGLAGLTLQAGPGGSLALYDASGTVRVTISSSGGLSFASTVTPSGTRDIGTASNPWREIFGLTHTAGKSGDTRGILKAFHGGSSAAPGVLELLSKGGTDSYVWLTDAGYLRRHTSLPTADTDGKFPLPVPLLLFPGTAKLPSSNPAVAGTVTLANLGGIALDVLDFDQTTEQSCYWWFPVAELLGATLKFYALWIAGTGMSAAEQVAWGARGLAIGDNVDPDTAMGAYGTSITDAVQTVGRIHISPAGSLSLVNAARGTLGYVQLRREVGHASDNAAGKARLVGLLVQAE